MINNKFHVRAITLLVMICGFSFNVVAAEPEIPPKLIRAKNPKLIFFDDFKSGIDIGEVNSESHKWYWNLWYDSKLGAAVGAVQSTDNGLRLSYPGRWLEITSMSHDGKQGFWFKYGYVEAVMRFNANDNSAWAALWMFSRAHTVGLDNSYGNHWSEIDIFENALNTKESMQGLFIGTIHDHSAASHRQQRNNEAKLPDGTDLTQFHRYAVNWNPGHIDWLFDDQIVLSADTFPINDQQEMYLVIGAQAHGKDGPGAVMDIKSISVWKTP